MSNDGVVDMGCPRVQWWTPVVRGGNTGETLGRRGARVRGSLLGHSGTWGVTPVSGGRALSVDLCLRCTPGSPSTWDPGYTVGMGSPGVTGRGQGWTRWGWAGMARRWSLDEGGAWVEKMKN